MTLTVRRAAAVFEHLTQRVHTLEHQAHVREVELFYRRDQQIRTTTAVAETRRLREEREEIHERVRHQIKEELRQIETRLTTRAASAEELTDQVYNRLARRLVTEKERLGW